ncbi:TraV family lipoprotein [Pseudovibrio sp. Ad37]|uniref:TraV family lipoprotein n=1 Tax=Pseudovibrio sp. Ad37 TaxID=989422 RepID=UPI0007B2ED9E|nr:Type IV conjugative transfer system lipoprotein (TraV) [Pseudovibrio sp. Ad37]
MTNRRRSYSRGLFALLTSITLAGCSSLGLGEAEFSCADNAKNVRCMSTAEMYEATNNGRLPSNFVNANGEHNSTRPQGMLDDLGYVSGQLSGKPTPIRSPAQVMRIWVAPREDTSGDLVMSGYVFTELEPRKWVVSAPHRKSISTLHP